MKQLSYALQGGLIRLGLWIAGGLPLHLRGRMFGAILARLILWVPPLRHRLEQNLALARPELPQCAQKPLIAEVGRNVAKTLVEILFNAEFAQTAADIPISGPGLETLLNARAEGKGAIIVSGHFGQWEAIRHALRARGLETGALYRPNNNPYYEPLFRAGIEHGGQPIIPRGNAGFRKMIRHIRAGGFMALLPDQYVQDGAILTFLGQPAVTSLAAAELAQRYDIPLVPAFAPRGPEGIKVIVESQIRPDSPDVMMQAFNERLGAWVIRHPEQWYWLHQRWKLFEWNLPQETDTRS